MASCWLRPETPTLVAFHPPSCTARAGCSASCQENIKTKVRERVRGYADSELERWQTEAFEPLLDRMQVQAISWESILDRLPAGDYTDQLSEFYQACLRFNLREP